MGAISAFAGATMKEALKIKLLVLPQMQNGPRVRRQVHHQVHHQALHLGLRQGLTKAIAWHRIPKRIAWPPRRVGQFANGASLVESELAFARTRTIPAEARPTILLSDWDCV